MLRQTIRRSEVAAVGTVHRRCVDAVPARRLRRRLTRRMARAFLYGALTAGALVMIAPFIWMVSTSVTPAAEVFAWPPRLVPSVLRFENYRDALLKLDFGRYLVNSLIVSMASTLSVLVLDSLAGYAFARLRFPGRGLMFVFILATMMIPAQVTMIPLFVMFRGVPLIGGNDLMGVGGSGLIDTYFGLVLPGMATTLGTYLMREFFGALPGDLADAARIDGCSEPRIFFTIYLPLAKPALATVGMLTFTESWNSFLWPLILTTKPEMRTLQLGLSSYKDQYFADWHLLMAAAVITSLPILVVFLAGQRQFIKGVAMSGLKGA